MIEKNRNIETTQSRFVISRPQALASLHLAVLLFGASGLIGKAVATPALVVTCVRSLVASAALLILIRFRGSGRLAHALRNQAGPVCLGGALLAGHWWSFFEAIQRSTVALGLLTFASYPLFVALLGWVFLRERVRRVEMLACTLVVAGLILVVPDWRFGSQAAPAAGLGLVSAVTFALLTLNNRRLIVSLPPLEIVALQTAGAGLLLLPLGAGRLGAINGRDWFGLIVLGVVFTGAAHACFTASLARVRVATVGVTAALEPVYGTAFAWLLLAEQPSAAMLAGGGLIIVAAILAAGRAGAEPGVAPES